MQSNCSAFAEHLQRRSLRLSRSCSLASSGRTAKPTVIPESTKNWLSQAESVTSGEKRHKPNMQMQSKCIYKCRANALQVQSKCIHNHNHSHIHKNLSQKLVSRRSVTIAQERESLKILFPKISTTNSQGNSELTARWNSRNSGITSWERAGQARSRRIGTRLCGTGCGIL